MKFRFLKVLTFLTVFLVLCFRLVLYTRTVKFSLISSKFPIRFFRSLCSFPFEEFFSYKFMGLRTNLVFSFFCRCILYLLLVSIFSTAVMYIKNLMNLSGDIEFKKCPNFLNKEFFCSWISRFFLVSLNSSTTFGSCSTSLAP